MKPYADEWVIELERLPPKSCKTSTNSMEYNSLDKTRKPLTDERIVEVLTVEDFGRTYITNMGRELLSNTTVLKDEMGKEALHFWAKKLLNKDGNWEDAYKHAAFLSEMTKYLGTVFHRSLERIIHTSRIPEIRREKLNNHPFGKLFEPYDTILGCELQIIGDGYATTLDLVLKHAESQGIHIIESKTLHRVGSNDDEQDFSIMLDRSLQLSKAAKYKKQLAAQAAALEYYYGIKATQGSVFVFDTVTFEAYETCVCNPKKLTSTYDKFKTLLEVRKAEIFDLRERLLLKEAFPNLSNTIGDCEFNWYEDKWSFS
jgi:hypothetical protein